MEWTLPSKHPQANPQSQIRSCLSWSCLLKLLCAYLTCDQIISLSLIVQRSQKKKVLLKVTTKPLSIPQSKVDFLSYCLSTAGFMPSTECWWSHYPENRLPPHPPTSSSLYLPCILLPFFPFTLIKKPTNCSRLRSSSSNSHEAFCPLLPGWLS